MLHVFTWRHSQLWCVEVFICAEALYQKITLCDYPCSRLLMEQLRPPFPCPYLFYRTVGRNNDAAFPPSTDSPENSVTISDSKTQQQLLDWAEIKQVNINELNNINRDSLYCSAVIYSHSLAASLLSQRGRGWVLITSVTDGQTYAI